MRNFEKHRQPLVKMKDLGHSEGHKPELIYVVAKIDDVLWGLNETAAPLRHRKLQR